MDPTLSSLPSTSASQLATNADMVLETRIEVVGTLDYNHSRGRSRDLGETLGGIQLPILVTAHNQRGTSHVGRELEQVR